ncbi:MAG: HNH endonuclease, partial [Actinobacteria bacterium]|nr:HNH endonuclease [Actinomycetota bacterium]
CETARGTILTPGQIAGLVFDAEIERVVFATPSRVIDVSHRTRFFRGGLRRAIEVRDRHCTHPGCNIPAHHCDIDHIVPYDQGGTTTQDNGRLLCPHHNHWTYNHHQTQPATAGPGP